MTNPFRISGPSFIVFALLAIAIIIVKVVDVQATDNGRPPPSDTQCIVLVPFVIVVSVIILIVVRNSCTHKFSLSTAIIVESNWSFYYTMRTGQSVRKPIGSIN